MFVLTHFDLRLTCLRYLAFSFYKLSFPATELRLRYSLERTGLEGFGFNRPAYNEPSGSKICLICQSERRRCGRRKSHRADEFSVSSAACGDSRPHMNLDLKVQSQEAY
jgi:hypothetical protein